MMNERIIIVVRKAFNNVTHTNLPALLGKKAIPDDLLTCIACHLYLSNHSQFIVIDGVQFRWEHHLSGLPQRSVIGAFISISSNDAVIKVNALICIYLLVGAECFFLHQNISQLMQNLR